MPESDPLGGLWAWAEAKHQLFSEYGHAAYQIKGNETYDNLHANILHTPLTPGLGLKVKTISCLKVLILHIKLN